MGGRPPSQGARMPARCDHRKRNHQSHPRDGLTRCCADASRLIGPPDRDRRIGSAGHFATRDVGGWADKGCARHNDGVVGGGVQLVPTAPAYPCARGISASDLHGRRKCRRIVGTIPALHVTPRRHPIAARRPMHPSRRSHIHKPATMR